MPEIEASEKRQGLHLAGFRSAAVESKENFLAGTPKMPAKCESQASHRMTGAIGRGIQFARSKIDELPASL